MAAKKKAAKKKTVAKKTVAKKTVAKKTAAKKKVEAPVKKIKAIADPMTKTALHTQIAENTELTKKQVASVFDELADIIEGHVKKRGAGQFTLPGLAKVTVVRKPATKKRKGINPFTGEETVFQAKPARNVVKVRPLKKLKDMVL